MSMKFEETIKWKEHIHSKGGVFYNWKIMWDEQLVDPPIDNKLKTYKNIQKRLKMQEKYFDQL